jgi:GTPase SAR1 family protein
MSYYTDCDNDNEKNTKKLKIVFLGDKSVGKSSIIRKFISNNF